MRPPLEWWTCELYSVLVKTIIKASSTAWMQFVTLGDLWQAHSGHPLECEMTQHCVDWSCA
jgi:hypothetical protein